jgi:hypothetical protein
MHHELAFPIPTCCKQSRHLCQTLGVKPGRGSFDFSQGACEGNCQRELGFSQRFSAGNTVLDPKSCTTTYIHGTNIKPYLGNAILKTSMMANDTVTKTLQNHFRQKFSGFIDF